jgi:plasmid stabilization system protein ParE
MTPWSPYCYPVGAFSRQRYTICTNTILYEQMIFNQEEGMPHGDKSKYTDKEKRQAEHIEEGYEKRGVSKDEAERRVWATVNAVHGGGEKPGGGGYGKPENHAPMRKGGRSSHKKK